MVCLFFQRCAALSLTLWAFAAPASAAAPDTKPASPTPTPIEAFFANPQLSDAVLSPNGRFLAAISGAPDRRDMLAVIDLRTKAIKLIGYAQVDVLDFQWVNDERLLFNVTDKRLGPGHTTMASGLYGVDRDGANLRQLAARRNEPIETTVHNSTASRRLPWHTFMLGQRGAQDSDWVYVESLDFDSRGEVRHVDLLNLNTRTGANRLVPRPGGIVDSWMLDNAGQPRLALASEDGKTTVHYRDPASAQWRVIATFDSYAEDDRGFSPLGFGDDGALYVTKYNGHDTASLYIFDFATGKVRPQPVVTADGYDFEGALVSRNGKLLGVRVLTDAYDSVWFDPAMKALQARIDALLPGTVNLLSVASKADAPWVLVHAYSDREPLSYILFDTESGKLTRIGDTYPDIDPARMGRQDDVKYAARDGRAIPALLTLPPGGGKKLPLVVLVHGGPYVRGSTWGWDSDSQFLASRGYAVLEPAFRGTTGFGQSHFKAGWKQWGLAMQDDIADGARWAIAQGIADPKRICIAGASYGGYATLMGLVRDPDLYQCGINWLGVTDIELMYTGSWRLASDMGKEWKKHGMPLLVGDRVKDAAQLKASSPIEQAARIQRPLLMAYGGADRRVPIYHGTKFRDAVTRTNKQVEWIEYDEEAHGWSLPKNRVDFWGRVEKFLDRHIGKDAGKPAATP